MLPKIKIDGVATQVVAMHTNEEVIKLARESGNTFAIDLATSYERKGYLSDVQWAWAHFKVQTALAMREQIEAIGDEIQMEKIVAMLTGAVSKDLKFPKIAVIDASRQRYMLDLYPTYDRNFGSVRVKSGYREIGRISSDGLFFPDRGADRFTGLVPILVKIAADPISVAREYARLTGKCCYCRLDLTDPRSVAAGFGPICARHYGFYDLWCGKKEAA